MTDPQANAQQNTGPKPDEGKVKQIKLSEADWEEFEKAAKAQNLTLSQWMCAQGRAGLPRVVLDELKAQGRKRSPHVAAAASGQLPAV
jgi:hypothetical protein